ncbi:fungal specific transcription factor domain-containing protein [Sarocladium implicatum]|nr:fungal specific transcription factor domain-containing protein [Sarocladium implicatum]
MDDSGILPMEHHQAANTTAMQTPESIIDGATPSPAVNNVASSAQLREQDSNIAPAAQDYSLAQQQCFPTIFGTPGEGFVAQDVDPASALEDFTLSQSYFRMNGFDWLDFDMPMLDQEPYLPSHPSLQSLDVPQNDHTAGNPPLHRQNDGDRRPAGSEKSISVDATSFPRPNLPNLVQPGTARNDLTLRPIELETPQAGLPWPFDQSREKTSHQYTLPPLQEVLQSTHRGGRSADNTYLGSLVQLLSDQRLPTTSQIKSPGAAQAFHDIRRFLDLYFDRFHDIQAIMHKPTWKLEACPTVLVTAMACVGALLSNNPRDVELSKSLSDICLLMLIWLGAADAESYSNISYLNALCLHQIYSLGSGNRELYQNADRSRGTLVGGLRGMGVLNAPWSIADEDEEASRHSTDGTASEDQEWQSWVQREQARRAAWAAFEYDCSLCTLTSRRGAVDLGELPSRLPCNEALWNAGSARAWLALRSRMSPLSFSPSLSAILKAALSGKEIPSMLGSWATRLAGQVLGRLLWDLKQLEAVAMPNNLGLSCLSITHKESKRSILNAMSSLLSSTASPFSTSELITYNITGLLCHYSHLYAAEDVMDAIVFIIRNVVLLEPAEKESLREARRHLSTTFAKDEQAGRALLWHACQIVAIAREYIVSAPCEIMRIFMGYIFIMSYGAYSPKLPSDQRRKQPLRLDVLSQSEQPRQAVTDWVLRGGPASVGSVQVVGMGRGSTSAFSQDAQAMMQNLKGWGLAEKFAKILDILGTREI